MDDLKDKLALIDLATLAQRAEQMQEMDRYAGRSESLVYLALVSKLQSDHELVKHLTAALERIDELARDRDVDRAKLAAVVTDAAETRRLTMAAVDRVNTLAQVVGAGMDEIARVSALADSTVKALRVQAELSSAEAKEQEKRTLALAAEVGDRD